MSRFSSFYASLIALLVGSSANADPADAKPEEKPPAPSLRSRFGVEGLRRPLRADASSLRQRAFERLGNAGTNAALELLASALAPGGEARDARERLIAVRALARHVDREIAVDALVRALASGQRKEDPRETLVEQTAALALARSNRPRAEQALAQALRQPGRVSENARIALLAHRPAKIAPLLEAPGTPTPALVDVLGRLADARAADELAGYVSDGPVELRSSALLALSRVDRKRALVLAGPIADAAGASPSLFAAARVLFEAERGRSVRAFEVLLREPSEQRKVFEFALEARSPELGSLLARVEPGAEDMELWLAALGRSGGEAALRRLERLLAEPPRGWAAAHALARSGDGDAEAPLERALEQDATRRAALRAAVLRELAGAGSVAGLEAAIEALERAVHPVDRATAAFARAALDPEAGARWLDGRERASVCAAARLASQGTLARAAARRLARESDPVLRACLAIALADPEAADLVPNHVLSELVESRGAGAQLGAYALSARDGKELRPRLRELLAGSDPELRTHVALGLARSRDSSAVGVLSGAYRFETEPRVRRAIVLALGARAERGRLVTLRLAAELDPDARTRAAAREALAAGAPTPLESVKPSQDAESAWLRLDPPDAAAPPRFVLLETSRGLVLPVLPDADGSVLVWPLPAGAISIRLGTALPGG